MHDEALDEIREVRHKISERFGHDTKAILDHYKTLEAEYSDRITSRGGKKHDLRSTKGAVAAE